MLPNPRRLGARGHHPALPYADVPAFMARLGETPGTASRALQFTILTAARSGETLGMTWDEVDFDTATWVVPAKMSSFAPSFSATDACKVFFIAPST